VEHWISLSEIVAAIIRGLAQRILDLAPFIDPWSEPGHPPAWWWLQSNWFDWYMHRDGSGVPDSHFIECWLRSSWHALGHWIDEVGIGALKLARAEVREWTGYVQGGWRTFADWIGWLSIRFGDGMVYWAHNAVHALERLYEWLPTEIKTGASSWWALWEDILRRARDWVVTTYQMLIAFGLLAWTWVADSGTRLKEWWQSARGVLDDFRSNPTGYILAHLGPTWDRLVWFVNNALDFYTGLWGQHSKDLAGFLADPAGWIYERLETYLERIW